LEDRQPLLQRTFCLDVCWATQVCASFSLKRETFAGGGPAATHFLLRRQKKVSKEKATPLSASRSKATGNLICGGLAGNRSNSAIASDNRGSIFRQPPSTQAHTEGEKWIPLVALRVTLPSCLSNSGISRSNARQSRASSTVPHAVVRRRVAQGGADQGSRLFEAKPSSSETPARPSNVAYRHSVPGDAFGSPFFSVVFFGEAKKSASPAGARPGLHLQPRNSKKYSSSTSLASATTGKPIRGSV
jgi:hypothetical protein